MTRDNGKVTMAVLGIKLDAQTKAIEGLLDAFNRHVEKDREVEIKVDRLDQIETRRVWHIRALWGSTVGGAVAWLFRALQ